MPETAKKPTKSKAKDAYSFSLVLEGASELTAEIADALYEAGCDDALVGSRDGVLFAEFDRQASSLAEAIGSAIRQVESAGIGMTVVRVEPDELVSAAEIADRVGLSRETIRLYALGQRGPGGFPPPIARLRGRSPLYRWTDVAPWLARHAGATGVAGSLKEAALVGLLNAALDLRRLAPRAAEQGRLHEALRGLDLLELRPGGDSIAVQCRLKQNGGRAELPAKRPPRAGRH